MEKVYETSNEKVLRVHQTMHPKFPIPDLDYELVKLFEIYHMYCTECELFLPMKMKYWFWGYNQSSI